MSVLLPTPSGGLERLHFAPSTRPAVSPTPPTSRLVYAASHVVADPLRSSSTGPAAIDWDATLALRHDIWAAGLSVAESMDTAQRGMGLDAGRALELAARTIAEDPRHGEGVAVGVTSDAITDPLPTLDEITGAYLRQIEHVVSCGGTPVIMASRHLVRVARGRDDYLRVYRELVDSSGVPVVLHWLGDVFDPALTGYWGSTDPAVALDTVVELIAGDPTAVKGVKISLLDPVHELALRDRIPDGPVVFTGDDFHYTDMMAGDGTRHSHALLGAFAALAPWAAEAVRRLDDGDEAGFRAVLEPTQALSRVVFRAPTPAYKAGVAWLAYLIGGQSHFRMLGGMESARDVLHLADLVRAANGMGYFDDPDLTAARIEAALRAHGIV